VVGRAGFEPATNGLKVRRNFNKNRYVIAIFVPQRLANSTANLRLADFSRIFAERKNGLLYRLKGEWSALAYAASAPSTAFWVASTATTKGREAFRGAHRFDLKYVDAGI
jgi:hypothetical protein